MRLEKERLELREKRKRDKERLKVHCGSPWNLADFLLVATARQGEFKGEKNLKGFEG